jgi:DNA-binding response OmpR family regulator
MAPAFAPHDDWVTKPFDPEELAIRVATAVHRSGQSHSASRKGQPPRPTLGRLGPLAIARERILGTT